VSVSTFAWPFFFAYNTTDFALLVNVQNKITPPHTQNPIKSKTTRLKRPQQHNKKPPTKRLGAVEHGIVFMAVLGFTP